MPAHAPTTPTARLLATAALAAALALPAAAENVLRIPYTYDIGSFDPDNAFEVLALSALGNVYEGLVEYVPGSAELRGRLAESWEVSDDGTSYTFILRPGVTYHDGTALTAETVRLAFARRAGEEMMLNYFFYNVTAMAAPDALTLVITLAEPQPSFLDHLASPWGPRAISPAVFAEHGAAAADWLTENAVGTGPFRLTRFARGEEYVLERFEGYHGTPPAFDVIEIPVIPDIGQQLLQLRAGDIDAVPTNYPWAQLGALPPGLAITAAPSMALVMAMVNPQSALVADPALRAAVMTAMNPAFWLADAFGAYATPARSLYPVTMLDPAEPVVFPADLEAAAAAIAAAGPVSLTLGFGMEETENVGMVADLIAAQLAGIGVSAEIVTLPLGAVYGLAEDPGAAPDLLFTRVNPDSAHPEHQATVFFTTDAVLNLMGASLPEADDLVFQGAALTDPAARDAAFAEAGRLWVEAGLFIPLADVQDVVVHAEGLVDLGLRPVFPPGNIDFGTVRFAD